MIQVFAHSHKTVNQINRTSAIRSHILDLKAECLDSKSDGVLEIGRIISKVSRGNNLTLESSLMCICCTDR